MAEQADAIHERTGPVLKHLTLLFIDTVGSTAMGTTLDPEDIHELMDTALRRFTTTLERFGARVLKYTGDGLLAAFGDDTATESDPETAVHAGLAVLAICREYADELANSGRVQHFAIRVGIDTGPVIIGGGIEGASSISGSTVNRAARMEQSAPPGGLRISLNTYRHVSGTFDVIETPATTVKGFEPAPTYVVVGAKPPRQRTTGRGIPGVETPLIGRETELQTLHQLTEQVRAGQRLHRVVVSAEAGIGKTRLLQEFLAEPAQRALKVLGVRCLLSSRSQPYGLLRALVLAQLDMADSEQLTVTTEEYLARALPLLADDAEPQAHLLGQLIGLDFSASPHVRGILSDPAQIRSRAWRAATVMLRASAARSPMAQLLLIVVDDAHWADDGSLDFLDTLDAELADTAVLLIIASRPSLFERRPTWSSAGDNGTSLRMEPLGGDGAHALCEALLRKLDEIPAHLVEVLERADGNPYFMEEIVKMLLDEGVLAERDQYWHVVAERLASINIPTTLMGVLQARLDALPVEERPALQQASVVGFLFWDSAVAAVDEASVAALDPLARRGFVNPEPESSLSEATALTFEHHLLHQFAYDSVLKRDRREYHARAARWLDHLVSQTAATHLFGVVAGHFERAGMADDAVRCYVRAAADAQARNAIDAVFEFVASGLALATPTDLQARWALLEASEKVLYLGADRLRHDEDLVAMKRIADELDDDVRRAQVAVAQSRAAILDAQPLRSATYGQAALTIADRIGDPTLACAACRVIATATRRLGDLPAAQPSGERAVALARQTGDRPALAMSLVALSNICAERGDLAVAAELAEEAMAISIELGDRIGEADVALLLGYIHTVLGDYSRGLQLLEHARDRARDLGWVYVEAVALLNSAVNMNLVGDFAGAVSAAAAAAELGEASRAGDVEAAAYLPMGQALTSLGDWDGALTALTRARQLYLETGAPHCAQEATAAIAQLHLLQGALTAALAEVQQVLDYLAAGGSMDGTDEPLRTYWICVQVLQAAGDPRAAEVLREAHRLLQTQAQRLTDPVVQQRYLWSIAHHRAIMEAAGAPETS